MMDIDLGRILILVSYLNMLAIGYAFILPDAGKIKETCDLILASNSALDEGNNFYFPSSA